MTAEREVLQQLEPPKVLPPHYFAVSTLVLVAIGLLDGARLIDSMWVYLGTVPMAVGLAIALQGSRQFKQADTNIIPLTESTTLVTDGVFAFSRNPMYLGMMLFLGGLAIIANSLWGWIVVAVFFVIIRAAFIAREEQLMAQTFADEYDRYASRVRRWI